MSTRLDVLSLEQLTELQRCLLEASAFIQRELEAIGITPAVARGVADRYVHAAIDEIELIMAIAEASLRGRGEAPRNPRVPYVEPGTEA